ncbi:type I-E CRISPR-associated protein Cse2/CasB [Nocardioides sp.]|uniref:type I-E CRISPR-associated protein Cse2/CasB n=1 Tax=Nocardioides sp. TaxID=35761 RepID=UPI0026173613|nr:type I-E CRISPR-associated protein Cse2/CasB [Nocardioides sp.]
MTTETTEPPGTDGVTTGDVLSAYVGARASQLQSRYGQDEAKAVAALARLRRAMTSDGRLNPQVWDVFDEMPPKLIWERDEPSPAERAAIAALTLFATHQQSRRDKGMHHGGHSHSLGRAMATLSRGSEGQGVTERFRALTRASDLTSVLSHLRALVTRLRGARIPLDYAALAKDLYDLQFPGGMDSVRIRWIRDFHRPVRAEADSPATDTATTTDPTDSGDDA